MANLTATARHGSVDTRTGVERALVSLAALSVFGALAIPARYDVGRDASGLVVTGILMGTPLAMFLAVALVRTGYVLASSTFAIATAAVGAIVAASLEPSLAAAGSTYLMLAAILVLGCHVMPYHYVLALGAFNLAAAVALPNFAPAAGTSAIQIPYVFLFSNAVLLVFATMLRHHDRSELADLEDHASVLEVRYDLLRLAAAHMQDEHEDEIRQWKERNSGQRHLLDAASHELRTPITPLLLQVAAFRRRHQAKLDDEQRRSLEVLERNLRRMSLLVSDLLDITRLENGRLVLGARDTDLAALAAQAQDTFSPQAEEAGVEIVLDVPQGLNAHCDPTRLSQVLYNLLSNAIKFSRRGGVIHLQARAAAGGVQIEVHDDGAGFDPARQRELFQPFGRVHDDRVKGTGLGLYICRGIVTEHGGQIWARSEGPGRGATFGIWLPGREPRVAVDDRVAAPQGRPAVA